MILIKNLIIFLYQKRKKLKLIVVLKSKSPGHSVKSDSLNQSLFNQTNSIKPKSKRNLEFHLQIKQFYYKIF